MRTAGPAPQVRDVEVGAQRLRIAVRPGRGDGPPLLLCNGMGASLELLAPFVTALDGVETITFDVPGIGGSAPPVLPIGSLAWRAWLLASSTRWDIARWTSWVSRGAVPWPSSSPCSTPTAAAS